MTVGLGPDDPVAHLAVRRGVACEHVVLGQVVADGALPGGLGLLLKEGEVVLDPG